MERVDIYQFQPNGTYHIARSFLDSEWPGYLRNNSGQGKTYILASRPVFAQTRPPRLEGWDDLLEYRPTIIAFRPWKYMMAAYGNSAYPIGAVKLPDDRKREIAETVELYAVEKAASEAARSDGDSKWTGPGLVMLAGAAVVLVIAIVLVTLLGGLPDDPVEVAEESVVATDRGAP